MMLVLSAEPMSLNNHGQTVYYHIILKMMMLLMLMMMMLMMTMMMTMMMTYLPLLGIEPTSFSGGDSEN